MHEHREKIIIAYARQAIKDIVLPSEKNISKLTKHSRAIIRKWQASCAEDPEIGDAIELTIWHPRSLNGNEALLRRVKTKASPKKEN